ncbi:uncharacterized protein LOC143242260 [Tachypleus tridentatus]|uniref:uncharacterized protein LOC143242260 n=1 Tax=Tachypleus tridentatus TaxID=6853 RepID=UPI003FCF48BC
MYQAVLGESAHISCNISLPSEDDSVSLVLWYKRGINAPIISMDSRRGPLKNAKYFTGELLGQRAYFNVSEQQSVLIINRVEKDDEGDYSCRVDFRYGRTLNDFMTLDVIVASKDVTILGNTNTPVYGKIGPYNEGSRLFLTCISGTESIATSGGIQKF